MQTLSDLIEQSPEESINLHIHSTMSDGNSTPYEIWDKIKESNLQIFSLADHDVLPEYPHYAAYKLLTQYSAIWVPGIEISSSCQYGQINKVHILAYFVNPMQNLFNPKLRAKYCNVEHYLLKGIKEEINCMVDQSIQKFNEYTKKNMPNKFDPLIKEEVIQAARIRIRKKDSLASFPAHIDIGQALVKKGCFKNINQARQFFYNNNLILSANLPDVSSIIEAVKYLGAADIVIAHPGLAVIDSQTIDLKTNQIIRNYSGIDSLILELQQQGLTGIEVKCPSHDQEMREHFSKFAAQYNLTKTIGGDNHRIYPWTSLVVK